MRYKINFLDITYDAVFRAPLFVLAGNPVSVLNVLHTHLSKKYGIAASDMSVATGMSVADIRAKVSLFNGNGSLEVSAEAFTARFNNPTAPEDGEIVQDCVQLSHDALSALHGGKATFKEEGVVLRMIAELLDAPNDAPAFLRSLVGDAKVFAKLETTDKVETSPGVHLEMLADEDKWTFFFDISRAHRNRKEFFLTTNMRYREGNAFPGLKQKADHFSTLLNAALARCGLEPQRPAQAKS